MLTYSKISYIREQEGREEVDTAGPFEPQWVRKIRFCLYRQCFHSRFVDELLYGHRGGISGSSKIRIHSLQVWQVRYICASCSIPLYLPQVRISDLIQVDIEVKMQLLSCTCVINGLVLMFPYEILLDISTLIFTYFRYNVQ